MRSSRASRALAAGLVALLVLAAVGYRLAGFGDPGSEDAADAYLAAWTRGDDRGAAGLTDVPEAALEQLQASRRGLDGATVRARTLGVAETERRATARVRVDWRIPRIGDWGYETRVALARRDERWQVLWSDRNVHPRLDDAVRLGTVRLRADRGDILDREGRALMTERSVAKVMVEVRRVRAPTRTAARLAQLLDVDEGPLARSIREAPKNRFLPVVTLRAGEFRRVEDRLRAIRGVSVATGTASLAPTRTFARAVLGAVGQVTAEQLERFGPDGSPTDEVGQWGLQAANEARLAGRPTSRIILRGFTDGAPLETITTRRGRRGRPLETTLDRDVQAAAERALAARRDDRAALVALQPSTGDVLAAANRPADSSFNRAFEGLYPPGSTFKVVTTAALLRDGLRVEAPVPCPATLAVGGRAFRNFEGGAEGTVAFRRDFAVSCNTAFVSLADRLDPGALTRAGLLFGLGRTARPGLPASDARVPEARAPVARAAMMIGQDRIVASPLAMAGVAGTVAAGRWRPPSLLRGRRPPAGARLGPAAARTLRSLMREVVTAGTGRAVAGLAGPVSAKSGTAEFGGGDPPRTHAWFIAFRGDLAVSVLVEGGRAGGEVAAPIVARFLDALDAGDR